ncbi:hypothetical protein [Aeromonas phage phiA014L]|uniref:Lipoprotein n=1 Tax=Aeromonas phage phiA014L TaxID=3119844 RepID=A0ABZ2CLS8_9CAUD
MQIVKYLLKWCTILCLGLIACAAVIVPGLAIYAKVDARCSPNCAPRR